MKLFTCLIFYFISMNWLFGKTYQTPNKAYQLDINSGWDVVSAKNNFLLIHKDRERTDSIRIIYQNQRLEEWRIKGIIKHPQSMDKLFPKVLGQKIIKIFGQPQIKTISYSAEKKLFSITTEFPKKRTTILTFIKLLDNANIALHWQVKSLSLPKLEKDTLAIIDSITIDPKLAFKPRNAVKELFLNHGYWLSFILISFAYLLVRLKQIKNKSLGPDENPRTRLKRIERDRRIAELLRHQQKLERESEL